MRGSAPWEWPLPHDWEVVPLLSVGQESKVKNAGLREQNLLSLSFGRIAKKDISASDGLLPASFETYQIVSPDDIVFRFTDLQNDQRSLRSARVQERGIITSAYMAFTPQGVDAKFLEYLMRAYDVNKVFYGMGGGLRQSLKFGDVRRIPIIVPPSPVQVSIADFLDRETALIDQLIEKQTALIELLCERRHGAIERQVADINLPLKPLGASTALIQTGPFGSQLSAGSYIENGTPVINPQHFAGGRIVADSSVTVDSATADRLSRHALVVNDVITARRGELGRAAVAGKGEAGFLVGTGALLIRPKQDWWDARFLQLTLSSTRTSELLAQASVGSTMPNLNSSMIARLRLPCPDVATQSGIVDHLDRETAAIDTLIAKTERMIALSRERRAALITAAVTGQIDVTEEDAA